MLITFFVNTKSKLEGILNSGGLNHACMPVLYLLDNRLSEQKAPKDFKERFSHLFGDVSLLLATALHSHFRMPVVLHLNRTLLATVKSSLIPEMKSLMETNSQSSESSNHDHSEEDFSKCSWYLRERVIRHSGSNFI